MEPLEFNTFARLFDECFYREAEMIKEAAASEQEIFGLARGEAPEIGSAFELDYPTLAGFFIVTWATIKRLWPKIKSLATQAKKLTDQEIKAEFSAALDEKTKQHVVNISIKSQVLQLAYDNVEGLKQLVVKVGQNLDKGDVPPETK